VGIFGIGASGILAEYTARLFSRIGLPAYVMNRTGFSLAEQLIGLQRGDVLIMMGQKSPHREGMTTLREAKRLGIPTILLTQAVDSRFSQEAQVVIDVPRGGDSSRMPLRHGAGLSGDDCPVGGLHHATKNGEIPETNQRPAPGHR
jgi:DNA-binding MurR/RpiR family transcriptional regulator